MKRAWKTAGYAYVGFAVINAGLAWMTGTARTGRQPGQNQFLDLNDKLLKFNLLARVMRVEPAYLTAPMVTLPDDVVVGPAAIGSPSPPSQFGRIN